MKTSLGTYFLGATVIGYPVLQRVRKVKNQVITSLGLSSSVIEECHITILPPFRATYEQATVLNINCSVATLFPNHPLVMTPLQIKSLSVMVWKRKNILYFPVIVQEDAFESSDFLNYVNRVRGRVLSLPGFTWRSEIPPTFKPHISILSFRGLERREGVQKIVEESKNDPPILFHVSYPTLYTQYGTEWRPLSHDPGKSK